MGDSIELDIQTQAPSTRPNVEQLSDPNQNPIDDAVVVQQLGPVDGGWAAWRLLVAAFVYEALLWGFPICFGVFQNYYSALPEFKDSPNIALIGTIAQGLYYVGAPFSAMATRRWPRYQRQQIWVGWPLCILGLVAGSFATSIPGLILTQGLMYGLGFVILTYPILSMVDEWWVARKGMAFGLISAASGVSGAAMPFAIDAMLRRYGYRVTLRASALAMLLLTAPLMPALHGRLPVSVTSSSSHSSMTRTNWSFLKQPLFWVYALSTLAQGLGFFFPSVYLPSYAATIGLGSAQGAAVLAAMSVAQVLGQFTFGYLSDRRVVSVNLLAGLCSAAATLAVLALWGTAKSLGLLLAFSLMYGFFGYGFGTMRVGMGQAVSSDQSATMASYSILAFVQGVGNILVGPVSAGLLSPSVRLDDYGVAKYKDLTIFTGSCLFASVCIIGLWDVRKLARFFRP